ncbi:metalloregulator ArsR/SmtB family transcription factor [Streptomyces avermitilis]|uniref:ArsR/SmtB family transcription factor n=1 Tax=Streptomyces avermitilis TaxID=33903 RepID=UPI0033F42E67
MRVTPSSEYPRRGEVSRDPVRLLSMTASREGGEICVCDLTPAFDLSPPTISHHLKLLKQAGLIDSERGGTWVYYRLLPETTDKLATVLTRPGTVAAEASGESAGATS